MSEIIIYGNELYHHGIKGQKWGERRFQNEDGSLTPAGRQRYGYGLIGRIKGQAKANLESNKRLNEFRNKRAQAHKDNIKKVLTGKRSIGDGMATGIATNARYSHKINEEIKNTRKNTDLGGQVALSTAGLIGAVGTYALGRVLDSPQRSYGVQLVGAFLKGTGQGMAISSTMGYANAGLAYLQKKKN